MDVQRRWVNFEGLFSGSSDIATLLPTESNEFASASTKFLAVMRNVAGSPRILDVVQMQGAQDLLDGLAETLAKIQNALGDYLEKERSSFPRFYFVGDEDLLEIMGGSKDIFRIMKHLKKMFAGIMAIEYNEKTKLITGMVSREGEHVELNTPVDLNKTPRVNAWLQKLESEMRKTLAKLLAKSLEHFDKFDFQKIDMDSYMGWLDSYPAQIIGITADIWWSHSCEKRLAQSQQLNDVLSAVEKTLELLSDSVLRDQPSLRRKKIETIVSFLLNIFL
uniref:Dynein heavy chain linker domain-containing protein n=1 Tax=Panagrolaimus davidi TaxID=227884 RepID=A0A914P9R6_9BILA